MSILTKYYKRIQILLLWYKNNDLRLAKLLIQKDIPVDIISSDAKSINFGKSSLKLIPENRILILDSCKMMRDLYEKKGFEWKTSGDCFLEARIGCDIFSIESLEEIFILTEVYLHSTYSIKTKGPCHIIDIGANVGISCTYFASQKWVKSISAFEPLPLTFQKAKSNLEINPHISRKIQIFNFGLSDTSRELEVQYSREWKGSVGVIRSSVFVQNAKDLSRVGISLRKASVVFRDILNEQQGIPVIVKMDCEGSEYDILPELASSGIIQYISAFIIEWHDAGAAKLEDILIENGFITRIEPLYSGRDLGMIYAFRSI